MGMFFITPSIYMFPKGQFLGRFCKVFENIRKYLRSFNGYIALA